jgi:mono/diheme cytochrome c family protein
MMKKTLILLPLAVFGGEWFITNKEYGKMLYNNPRGISCAKCHGQHARGKIIAKYKKHGKTVTIKAPNIQNITYEDLKKRLLHYHKLSVMPKYNYLTKQEIEALFLYIKSQKGKK